MTPTSRRPWIALALLASFPARAERFDSAQDFASSGGRFQAVPDASSLMTDLQPHLSARTRFFFHEGYDPLRSPLSEGLDAFEAQLHLEGTIALFNHFLVGFDLPTQYTRPSGFALRDATVRLAGRFVGGQGDPLAVGIDGWAFLPSGSPEQKSGDTQARGFVRLVVSGDTPRLSYAGNVGYYHRSHEVIASDYEIGSIAESGLAIPPDRSEHGQGTTVRPHVARGATSTPPGGTGSTAGRRMRPAHPCGGTSPRWTRGSPPPWRSLPRHGLARRTTRCDPGGP